MAIVDQKLRWQIERRREAIASDDFTEDDVFSLLLMLRAHAPRHSAVREFADFIAHRDKDRGAIFDYVSKAIPQLERLADRTPPARLEIKPVYSENAFATSVNQALGACNVHPLDGPHTNAIAVCGISLLQHVVLVRNNVSVGRLDVFVLPDTIDLSGTVGVRVNTAVVNVTFVVFSAANRVIPIPRGTRPISIDGISWAGCQGGRFVLEQRPQPKHQ